MICFKINSLIILLVFSVSIDAQMIHRYGTTTGNFLEIGVDSRGSSMGEAFVAVSDDISSIYWNPAGLANLKTPTLSFMSQPWLAGINMSFTAGAFIIPRVGNIGFGLTQMNYGEMAVTTLEYQEGTGENFTASDIAASFTFSRKIVPWFSFGSTIKYVRSNIWHSAASAVAVDLGVLVNTEFFSFTGKEEDGLNIGMSISNYGTRMRFDGIDIYQPIDISEYEEGNYGDVAGQFRPSEWELPLIFRIGVALKPLVTNISRLTVSLDALHPNNNSESINFGCALDNTIPGVGEFSIRGGIKALYMDSPEYGYTGGFGLKMFYLGNKFISVDYAFKAIGLLGNVHVYTLGFSF
jgi:hypothetical protein|tara:strand:+ start:866 stop:1921 length:1056 start_codon:yes stop_codon:yes gene_type:complete